jgi:RNA polymerase sigma factor (sigma-70 family)
VRASGRDLRTDAEIVLASVADPESFSVIFERHFDNLYGYLARRVGREVANELAAEVFVVAFRRRALFDARQVSSLPWLFGVASNLLRNHARTERRQLRAYSRTGVDPVIWDAEADVDQRIDAERAGPIIARALLRLRDDDRDALLLFAWGSLTYDQIAQTLGLLVGTVRSRLARARRQFRELLALEGQLEIVDAEPGGKTHER